MLRIQNRIKHDNAELLTIVDRCSQIMKDDRLILRQMIKENNNEIITLVTTYKKKNDLRLLQQELRKLLNKQKKGTQQIPRTTRENQVNVSQTKTSRTPAKEGSRLQLNRNILSPPQRSLSRQTKQTVIPKQENSPRFNEDVKHNSPNSPEFHFVSPTKIEQQRQQLEQFELKLKQYTSGDNHQKLFDQKEYQKKRDDVVLASFQNFPVSEQEKEQTVNLEEEQRQNMHKRQYSYMTIPKEMTVHQHHNTEIIEIKLSNQSRLEQSPQLSLDTYQFHDLGSDSKQSYETQQFEIMKNLNCQQNKQLQLFSQHQYSKQSETQLPKVEEKNEQQQIEIKDDLKIYKSLIVEEQKEVKNTVIQKQENEDETYKPVITEDDIMKKYADLFTAPDFLKQCRATCQTQKTHDSFADSRSLNFMVPCQSMVCQEPEPIHKGKYQILSQLTAEQIFDEIFPEASLSKISKAFFRFKMEAVFQELQKETSQEELDELFQVIDTQKDGFVDVNEIGQFLDSVCPHQDRSIYDQIDNEKKGYFDEQHLSQKINKGIAKQYFQEVDVLSTNKITYWEFYLKRSSSIGQEVLQFIQQNLD